MDIEQQLADFIAGTGYRDLPAEAVAATRRNILDTLGCAVGGSGAPGCREVVNLVTELGGKESSSILVYGRKAPPSAAALANATMGHALDFDDTHDAAILHAGVATVPAALAVSEYLGGVSGKDMITAVTLGIDLACRLALATTAWVGWILTPLYGFFGAAAVSAKLLGLDREGTLNALGIAYAQASGNSQCIADGALTKRVQIGFAASGGVTAALLARNGVTGARRMLEGESGIFRLYQRGEYDRSSLMSGLGKRFEVTRLSYKPYPCCRSTHSAINAAIVLAETHDIQPGEIAEIVVGVNKLAYEDLCQPAEVKREPRNIVDAQFSVPYTTAVALTARRVGIDDFTDAAVRRPGVLALAAKVRCHVDGDIDRAGGKQVTPARVGLRLKDGREFSMRIDLPRGDPQNPMTREEFGRKLVDCVGHAARPLGKTVPDELARLVDRLEDVEDVAEIAALLSPRV
ncbi:MAG: MmgE/PrpD family protein [Chloroflexi bacterium]|nr:MmgE/PrpD family protein [Chloroflexota bacterium]